MSPYHFDERYDERLRLEDGTLVHLRLIGPEDKALLQDGFTRLSPESRYRRFFAAKRELSPQDLRYFTEFDGVNHLAIGAVRVRGDRSEEGLGVARFVRLPDDPKVAEAAVVVVDDYQNKGLGHLLLLRLVAAAKERGVERFRATTLAENPAARSLMTDLGAEPVASREDETLSVDVALPDTPPTAAEMAPSSGLYRLFRSVAQGITDIIQTHG